MTSLLNLAKAVTSGRRALLLRTVPLVLALVAAKVLVERLPRDRRHRLDGRRPHQAPRRYRAQPQGQRDHPPEPLPEPGHGRLPNPATIIGYVGIGIAVVFHEGSTLVVIANALRLLAYRNDTSNTIPTSSKEPVR